MNKNNFEIRLAHVIDDLRVGGAERHFVSMLNTIDCESRIAVFFGQTPTEASFYDTLDLAIEQHFLRIRRPRLPVDILRLAVMLRRSRCNVVHTHMFWANLYGSVAAKLAGIPVVVTTEHGENSWKRGYHRWLERNVISRLVSRRFCVSTAILQKRRDLDRIPADLLVRTANGTPIPPIVPEKTVQESITIGAVGRFVRPKDYPLLLAAAVKLRNKGHHFRLYIVGDGPDMESIKSLIRKLELTDIIVLPGLVTDVRSYYNNFDIYVSSSLSEGQPIALLEAMAHQLPVVATAVGAVAETVQDGVCGIIVPRKNVDALAEALEKLIVDKQLRRRFAQNARRRVEEKYSIESVAKFYVSSYRDLLSQLPRDDAHHCTH